MRACHLACRISSIEVFSELADCSDSCIAILEKSQYLAETTGRPRLKHEEKRFETYWFRYAVTNHDSFQLFALLVKLSIFAQSFGCDSFGRTTKN